MSYQTKVYHQQGGDAEIVASGGTIRILSGGIIDVRSGGILRPGGGVVIGQGAVSTVLSIINLPEFARIVVLSGTSNLVNASFWLTSCSAGRQVFLLYPGPSASNASGVVNLSCSGCVLLGSVGISISVMALGNSASHVMLELLAVEDNVWAIVRAYGNAAG